MRLEMGAAGAAPFLVKAHGVMVSWCQCVQVLMWYSVAVSRQLWQFFSEESSHVHVHL